MQRFYSQQLSVEVSKPVQRLELSCRKCKNTLRRGNSDCFCPRINDHTECHSVVCKKV